MLSEDKDSSWPLYAAAFMMAFSLGIWWLSMPFIIKRLGGTGEDVGRCFALHMGAYACGCLLTGSLLHHLNPKRTATIGVSIMILTAVLMCAIVLAITPPKSPLESVAPLIMLFGCTGLAMSFYWPFLMSWLSADHEGRDLNRRLGTFNTAWACGGLVSPLLGGLLVERSSSLPLVVTVVTLTICFLAVIIARGQRPGQASTASVPRNSSTNDSPTGSLNMFRWISRIALFSSCVCIGTIRTQLGLLFKFELNYSESNFGIVVMVITLGNILIFTMAGRWHFWHYRLAPLVTGQLLVVSSLLLILYSNVLWLFFIPAAFIGVGGGFIYSSHLYYGITGSKRRSARMAIHEITLSSGIVTGALVAGWLSEHISPYAPYWFAVAAMTGGILTQTIVWFALKPRVKFHT